MKALVTGATGFVGTHLVHTLLREGWEVTALVRSPAKAAKRLSAGVVCARGDLDAPDALAEGCRGADVVFHLAGLVAARSDAEFDAVNRAGTARLVSAARDAGVGRFLLVSSLAAAGPSRPGTPLSGASHAHPVTAYGRSKLAAESEVRAGGVPWTILRPPTVYGPWDTELLKAFQVIRRGIAPVFGDGSQELSAVFGPDLAEALLAAATAAGTTGGTYYPCHPAIVTSADLVRAIGSAMQTRPRLVRIPGPIGRALLTVTGLAAKVAGQATILNADKASEFFAPAWTCDPAPLTRDTGWQASRDLARGLRETLAWYRSHGWL